MYQHFIDWKPSAHSVYILNRVDDILLEWGNLGYVLTLRQLYYQLVSRDIIPNSDKEYAKLGNIVKNGRLSGKIDWNMIEDRSRSLKKNSHWDNPMELLMDAAEAYGIDKWDGQSAYIEVWAEKDAVSNIIWPVCRKYDVKFIANRGYTSETVMYDAYKRMVRALKKDSIDASKVRILYFGDHDPSGMDMVRDIENRMGNFFFKDRNKRADVVNRIALNMDQIEKYNPPENPAKITDTRASDYIARFGNSSWELDALEPNVLEELVKDAIWNFLDIHKFDEMKAVENNQKDKIRKFAKTFK